MDTDWFTLGLDTLAIATSNLVGGVLYFVARDQAKIIKNLEKAPSLDVGPALKALLEESSDKTLPYVAINGQVKGLGSQVIQSPSGLKGVLQAVTVNEHSIRRYTSGNWGSSIREIAHTQNEVPFGIKGSSGVIVEVTNPFSSNHKNLLKTVNTEYSPTGDTGLVDGVLGFITGSRSTGVETTEDLLPIDTNITAVGKLVMTGKNKYVIMPTVEEYNPYVLTTSLRGFIDKLQGQRQIVKVFSWIFFSIGLAISANKLWSYWKQFEEKRRRDRASRQRRDNEARLRAARNAQAAAENADPNANTDVLSTCVVCLENPREVILLPCGHFACCFECESQLNSRCPVCRANYTDTHIAFMA